MSAPVIILITTLVITAIGIVVGAGLVFTGKKFHVPVDERETQVRECLPGNNCGACGFAGCDAAAAAIVAGDAPVNVCPVGGGPVASMEIKTFYAWMAANEAKRQYKILREDGNQ